MENEVTETAVEDSNTEVAVNTDAAEDTTEENEVVTEVEEVEEVFTSIDDLLSLTEEDFEEFTEEANHKNMKPLHSWMQHVPADVRKHIANLRSSYTRKTQEVAQMRRELEAEREALRNSNRDILDGELAKQVREVDTEAEYDLFDKEGMQKEIQRQAALMMQKMLQPAQEQLQLQQRRAELQSFKEANPELNEPEYKRAVADLLRSRPNLSLEDAFYITKAKMGATEAMRVREEKQRLREERRTAARMSSGGSRAAVAKAPKFKSAVEAYEWHKKNGR